MVLNTFSFFLPRENESKVIKIGNKIKQYTIQKNEVFFLSPYNLQYH